MDLKKVPRQKWSQTYTRLFSIHKTDLYLKGAKEHMTRFFGDGLSNLFSIGKGVEAKWHFDDRELDKLGVLILKVCLEDAKNGVSHISKMINWCNVRSIRYYDKLAWRRLTNSQLLSEYRKFTEIIHRSTPIIYAPLSADRKLFSYAKKLLVKKYKGEELKNAYDAVTTPVQPIPIMVLEQELLRASLLPARKVGKAIRKILKEYTWYNHRFVDTPPATAKTFLSQIKKLKHTDQAEKLKKMRSQADQRRENFNAVIKAYTRQEQRLFKLVNEYSMLRHTRDMYRGKAYYYGYFLYSEILRRYHLIFSQLFCYTEDEVVDLISQDKKLSQTQLLARSAYVYFFWKGQPHLIVDPKEISALLQKQMPDLYRNASRDEVRGQVAYRGKASGSVRVITIGNLTKDLKNFAAGEILVAASTKPEYVQAMRKATAIVTEEGGITSHAAIIAREFRIPCVIGTKVATKVFKTGDRVIVDANQGLVRKV